MREEEIDLTPELLLQAYASGIFPMAEGRHDPAIGWYDPKMRGILPLDALHVPARLRRSVRAQVYDVTFNRDFEGVIRACADARAETWINDAIIDLYIRTHRLGYAHSVEVRTKENGALVGGLYGMALGGAFFGESMFSRARDASKIGFVHLAARLRARGFTLWDAQFVNPHLLQFGCIEIPRAEYHRRLRRALLQTDVHFMGADYSSGLASVSSASLSTALSSGTETGLASGLPLSGAASDGSASDEYFSDFADVTDFLQSITQTS